MKTLIAIMTMISVSGLFAQDTISNCKTSGLEPTNAKQLSKKLIGKWIYSYSFYGDSCFYINDLGDLSKSYYFKITDTSIIRKKLPKLYAFGSSQILFGLISNHDKKPFGRTSSYPLVDTYDEAKSIYAITHYMGNGPGKSYSYFLEGVNEDMLIIRNSKYYDFEKKKISGIKHVYIKQKE